MRPSTAHSLETCRGTKQRYGPVLRSRYLIGLVQRLRQDVDRPKRDWDVVVIAPQHPLDIVDKFQCDVVVSTLYKSLAISFTTPYTPGRVIN